MPASVQAIDYRRDMVHEAGGIAQGLGPFSGFLAALKKSQIKLRQVVLGKSLLGVTNTQENFFQIGNQPAVNGAGQVFAGNFEGFIEHQTVFKHFSEIVGKNRKLKPVFDLILQMTISQSQVVFGSSLYYSIVCIWFNYAKNQYLAAFLMPSEIHFSRSQPKGLNFQDILDILYETNLS